MPTSQAGSRNNRARASGFTLVELLVVVTIVSILALGVGVRGSGLFARGVAGLGARFQTEVARLSDAALLGRGQTGIYPQVSGWQGARRDADGAWVADGPRIGAAGATLSWRIANAPYLPPAPGLEAGTPPIVFNAGGGGRSFAVTLGDVRCRHDGWGALECD